MQTNKQRSVSPIKQLRRLRRKEIKDAVAVFVTTEYCTSECYRNQRHSTLCYGVAAPKVPYRKQVVRPTHV